MTDRIQQRRTLSSFQGSAVLSGKCETVGGHYVVTLVRHTRESSLLALGASPRAGIALLRMAKARAAAHGRDYVVPEDVQSVARAVLSHRVIVAPEARAAGTRGEDAIERALAEAVAPR